MSITGAQLREAAHLFAQMLTDAKGDWTRNHLLVWRSAR